MITSKRKQEALINGEIPMHLASLPLVDFIEKKGVVVLELTDETRERLQKQSDDRMTSDLVKVEVELVEATT